MNGSKRVVSVSVVCLCVHEANWELQLAASAQCHERVLCYVSLAWEKIRIQSMVFTECVLLWHHHKVEKSEVEPL